ncbi:MAG: HAD hydrolase-like protein [Butyrivibrio sp.]|nr:HAD hydrolase-like protein [Butyrivibrio sp.]
MSKYKNILFDLDGTLTDSSEGIIKCVLHTYEKMGATPPAAELLPTFIGPPLSDSFVRCGIKEEDVRDAIDIYRQRYNTVGKYENKPYPGIPELLQKLNDEGYNLYVATSKPEKTSLDILEHYDLAKYFKEIAGATYDSKREKKEDVIRYLLDKIAVGDKDELSDTVMIGDTTYDVTGAAEFNIPCIAVTWGFGDLEDMKAKGAIAVVNTMDELYKSICG